MLEPELSLVRTDAASSERGYGARDSSAYALPLTRARPDTAEDVHDLDPEELEPLEASVAFGGRDTLTDLPVAPVVRGVEVPQGGGAGYAGGPAVVLDTQKRVASEREFLDQLDRRLRDD